MRLNAPRSLKNDENEAELDPAFHGSIQVPSRGTLEREENKSYIRLWTAVILSATGDVFGKNTYAGSEIASTTIARERNRNDALRWFLSKSTKPCSFIWACGIVGVNPVKIVQRIEQQRLLGEAIGNGFAI